MNFFKSYKFRNILFFTVVFFLVLLIFGMILYQNFRNKLFNDIDAFLKSSALNVADSIDTLWEKERSSVGEEYKKEVTINNTIKQYFYRIIKRWVINYSGEDPNLLNLLVQIYDEKGEILNTSKWVPKTNKIDDKIMKIISGGKNYYEISEINTKDDNLIYYRVIYLPIFFDNKLVYIVKVGILLRTTFIALNNLKLILFLFLPVVLILVIFFAFMLTNSTLNPINKMMNTISNITAKNLKLRIEIPDTDDEIKRLATTFNDMLDRLDSAFTSQRELIENLSHELKTPLSIIKGEIEVANKRKRSSKEYVEILKSILDEVNKIINIVNRLLMLSKFESKVVELSIAKVNINQIVDKILDDFNVIIEEKKIDVIKKYSEIIVVNGDEFYLKSLFINLIDNAIKYNKNGGYIEIVTYKKNNHNVIEISDSGYGISEEELPYIFDRYYRNMKSNKNSGFGLGLSIVKSVIDLHKAKIEIKSKLDKGTTFIIYFN